MRRSARPLAAGTAVLGLTLASLVCNVPKASAEPECLNSTSDFDGDGSSDVVVGSPGGSGRSGAVQVRISNEDEPYTVTLRGAPGFGTAVTSLSSYSDEGDEELCSQLVVGSPDESLFSGHQHSGAVYVYYFDVASKRFVSRGTFAPQAQGVGGTDQSGARFGAALATEQRPADEVDPRPNRLYVGAPGFDVDGVRDAGRVTSFTIDNDEDPSAHGTQTIDYGEETAPGYLTANGRLGTSLSVGGGLVVAGAPGQTASGVTGAGTVLVAPEDPGPDDFMPVELSQARPRVPGAAEKGDQFGAAVHLEAALGGEPHLLVGAPGEDLGRTVDAGAVTIAQLSDDTGLPVGAIRAVDQNSPKMAGTAEKGDAFGSSVSTIQYGNDDTSLSLVGTPGEDVGSARDAGMVQTVGNGVGWTQNTKGVPGHSESGDRMGASLGGAIDTGADRPLIGVPGENASTGAVIVGLPGNTNAVRYLNGTRAGDRYGFAVAP